MLFDCCVLHAEEFYQLHDAHQSSSLHPTPQKVPHGMLLDFEAGVVRPGYQTQASRG